MPEARSNFGYTGPTINGRDENGRSSSVRMRADETVHGHVWLPSSWCVAYILEDGRAYVEVDRVRKRSWEKVLAKRESALQSAP